MSAMCAMVVAAAMAWMSGQAAPQPDSVEQELRELREQVALLREQMQALAEQIGASEQRARALNELRDPEAACLAALQQARSLEAEQRLQLLMAVLDDDDAPPLARNAAFVGAAELLEGDADAEAYRFELIQQMILENTQRYRTMNPRTGQRVPVEAYDPQRREGYYGDFGSTSDPYHRPWRYRSEWELYRAPPGRGLELDLRSPEFYLFWHPDDQRREEPRVFPRISPFTYYGPRSVPRSPHELDLRPERFRRYDFRQGRWDPYRYLDDPRYRPNWW